VGEIAAACSIIPHLRDRPSTARIRGAHGCLGPKSAGIRLPDRLANLDQVAIGVTDVGPDLTPMVFRLSKELGSFGRPVRVDLLDVRHADIEERTRLVGVRRRCEGYGGLIVGGATAGVEDQPGIGDLHDDRITLHDDLPVE
jgi:hypothetical protein